MTERTVERRRLCPTRTSGAHSLIAHWITPETCLERQRNRYHKCFACQYRGQGVAVVLPVPEKPAEAVEHTGTAEPTPAVAQPVRAKKKRVSKSA